MEQKVFVIVVAFQIKSMYKNAFDELQEKLKNTIEYMEECYKWINDLCLDPEVTFDYEEQYVTDINYERVDGNRTSFPSSNATYSDDKEMDTKTYPADSGAALENISYAFCNETTCSNALEPGQAENISTLVTHLYYRKIEANGSAEYANTQSFQTNYPTGSIDTVSDPSALRPNYSYLGLVFPVALNTPYGVYSWTLNFSKLGQYNDYVGGCSLGRLDTVIAALGQTTDANLEYVCVYVVDCDDCDYDCVGPGCVIDEEPSCPDCDVTCDDCVFNGDGDTFIYSEKSVNDIDANNNIGNNWKTEKGLATQEEIEQMGESVYIDAEYVYVMTPQDQKRLQDYNRITGTYVEEHLNYHELGGVTNAYGTSRVLDEGEARGFFKEVKRNREWTLWTGAITAGVGVAWK